MRQSTVTIPVVMSLILVLATLSLAKVPIEVIDQSEDAVGVKLVYKVKEEFRRSEHFRAAETDEQHVKLILSTMDRFGEASQKGYATMYAAIWLLANPSDSVPDYYYTSTIGYAGDSRIDGVAGTLVAQTDKYFGDWLRWK